jgi:MFS family permease
MAGLSLLGWTLAGIIWGVIWPLLAGVFTPYHSLRQLFGNTVIAGGVTVAFIFFASEYQWRRRLPEFFPRGDLSAVRRVPRFTVRVRLLAIFLLIGVVPLAVLGMFAVWPGFPGFGRVRRRARGARSQPARMTALNPPERHLDEHAPTRSR